MNDPTSWDPSLVKKFSSSNHYKLLNQLRNEVKKYPLNNKKKLPTQIKDTNTDKKDFSNITDKDKSLLANKSNNINDEDSKKSTVSFNNSKNFSIYNQSTNNSNHKNECSLPEQTIANDETPSQSFKERLNQIDMK